MEKRKVAVISCGMIANKAHLPAYHYYKDRCEVTAVCDINPESAQQTAQRFGISNWYTDAEKMLAEQRPDLVSVCVPNGLHKPMTMLALSYGAHVLCEKPLALTYADAKEMFGEAARIGKTLTACQVVRYYPEYLFTRELFDQGMLGDIYYGEFALVRRRGVPKWGAFHKKAVSGGGVLCDLGVHMIDAALWAMGNAKVKSVVGMSSSYLSRNEKALVTSVKESGALAGVLSQNTIKPEEFEVEEFAAGSMRLANGGCMNFKTAWAVNLPPAYEMKLAGTKAGILLPEMKVLGTLGRYQADILPRTFPEEMAFADEPFHGHFKLIGNVLDQLQYGAAPMVRPEETLHVTAIIEAFYRSAAEGREVPLAEITG